MFVFRGVMLMPVVEEVVMQQGRAHKLAAVAAKVQALVDLQGAAGDVQNMVIDAHVAVLYKIFCPAKIRMVQNFRGIRAQERFHLFIFFVCIH
jgi:hypothetical protein